MKIIVGLGNPGAEYEDTRHNFGFAAVDYLAEKFDVKWKNKSKFSAQVVKTSVNSEKSLLVKPTTFYNLSGTTVRAIRDFYNLTNDDILIIHDEMALPIGTLRTRLDGQDAGNNGIKSLNQNIGEKFARIRIGSGKDHGNNGSAIPEYGSHADFVLSRPTLSEKEKFHELLPRIEEIVTDFINGNFIETSVTI